MSLTNPLDLKTHLVTILSGTQEIFTFVALLVVAFIMSKFNFSNKVSLSLFALFGVIMAAYLPGIYILINLIVGITAFYSLSKFGR